ARRSKSGVVYAPAMAGLRVLIVDDIERDLRSVEQMVRLVAQDVEVVGTASSGEEALQLATTQPCDVAIVDYRMPGMDGVEVASRLKEIRPDCKVIILTAFDDA